MSDIFREVDEDLRREQMERLWKRYGALLIGAAVLIVAATAGHVGWRQWTQARAEEQTALLLDAAKTATPTEGETLDRAAAAAALAAAAAKLDGTPATLARLREASLRAAAGETAAAIAIYDQLAGSGSVDPLYRELSTLLVVMHQFDSVEPAQLQGRLAPLMTDESPWRWSARELAGLLAAKTGDTARAHELFTGLADDPQTPAGIRARATDLAALYAAPK